MQLSWVLRCAGSRYVHIMHRDAHAIYNTPPRTVANCSFCCTLVVCFGDVHWPWHVHRTHMPWRMTPTDRAQYMVCTYIQQTPKTVANALPNKNTIPRTGFEPGPSRHESSALPTELHGTVIAVVRLVHSGADVFNQVYGVIYTDTRHSWRSNPFACITLVLTSCCSSPLAEVQARSTDFKVTDP